MNRAGAVERFLYLNLSTGESRPYPIPEKDQRLYLGGKGLAIKIFYDLRKDRLEDIDPLGEENLLIFAAGPYLGTKAPCSARFEVVTKSPLTGLLVGSSCGGPFGEALRSAGWDGVILSGKADRPGKVLITPHGAELKPAAELWGLETSPAEKALGLDSRDGAVLIGPAGENLVRYANIRSGHRFAGRGGAGAIMGAKRVKALVVRHDEQKIEPSLPEEFAKSVRLAKRNITRNDFSSSYRSYGTAANVRPAIRHRFYPVDNFRGNINPEEVDRLSGEAMRKRYSSSYSTCRACVILCGHKGTYPDGGVRQIPEYETVGMFGGNIGNYDPDRLGLWNERLNELGMDTISAGGTIAWAMEAAEKEIRPSELRFGRSDDILSILDDIAFRRNEGDELAEGSRILSEKYGGGDFAMQVKGLECAAYDPRASWGQGLSYAVYNKGGCHLGSFMIGLERFQGYLPALSTAGKASWTVFCEDLYAALNSLQICQFTAYGILTEPPIPRLIPKAILRIVTVATPRISQLLMDWSLFSKMLSAITGRKLGKLALLKAGERITKLERWINLRMSDRAAEDTLPLRFTREGESPVPLEPMRRRYYKLRKYSREGRPQRSDVEKLMEEKL